MENGMFHEIKETEKDGRLGIFVRAGNLGLAWQIAEKEAEEKGKRFTREFPKYWKPEASETGWFFEYEQP